MGDNHAGTSEEAIDSLMKRILENRSEEENMVTEPKDSCWNAHEPKMTQDPINLGEIQVCQHFDLKLTRVIL